MSSNKYKAAIIGAGSIGALKPDKFDSKDSENVLTIANAFYRNENIDLIGIVDLDPKKALDAASKWETSSCFDINSFFNVTDYIDIVAICVNTENHFEVMQEVVKHKPKLIMLEKPAGMNYEECLKIKELSGDIPIAIDYIRRYDKTVREFKKSIDNNEFGKIYNCTLRYGRGLRHEACHAVDLMRYLFGEIRFIDEVGSSIVENNLNDPSMCIRFACENCNNVIFLPVDSRAYNVFNFDIYTEKGRFEFTRNGQFLISYGIMNDGTYGNYGSLSNLMSFSKTELTTALSVLADNLVNFLEGKEELYCTINDALRVHKVYKILGV